MTLGNDTDSFTAAGAPGQGDPASTGTREQAKQTAGTAAEETQHVASVAADEVQRVAAQAKTQVQQLLGEATSQVEDHSRAQKDRLVGTLRTLTGDLENMSNGASEGMAAELVKEVADRARSMTSTLEGREPRELLDDLRSYARRKPGTFLVGALAAGVVAGRLTRGAKAAQSNETTGSPIATSSGYQQPTPVTSAERVDPLADPLTDPMRTSSHPTASDPFAADRTDTDRP